jgi:hypothetical protein
VGDIDSFSGRMFCNNGYHEKELAVGVILAQKFQNYSEVKNYIDSNMLFAYDKAIINFIPA